MRQVKIYDTTLRDGTQAEDFNLSLADKIRIAQKLAYLGIHYIEGGWPGANPKDKDFFSEIRNYELGVSRIAAFGSTHHKDRPPESDSSFAGTPHQPGVGGDSSSASRPCSRSRRSSKPRRSATWNSSPAPWPTSSPGWKSCFTTPSISSTASRTTGTTP